MSKTHKIDLELRRENKQCKLIIGELVKYVDDLTRTINRLTKSNDELKHKLFYYDNPHTPTISQALASEKGQEQEKRYRVKPRWCLWTQG